MYDFAGIIMTIESAPLEERMRKFCNYYGEYKPEAFCNGWSTIFIDEDEHLHVHPNSYGEHDLQVYCPTLSSYFVRDYVNPWYGMNLHTDQQYFPAGLATLVTPSDEVFHDDEIEDVIEKCRKEHPDWGIFVIRYHY